MLSQVKDIHLIPGESSDSDDPEDARQWLTIYRELVSFAERTLRRLQAMPESNGDVTTMQTHLQRLHSRLGFWEQRFWQLIGLNLDWHARVLRNGGRRVKLTRREIQLLAFLAQRPQQCFSGEQLLTSAWRAPDLSEEQLRTYVVRLRRRLAEAAVPVRLVTVPGRGYRLDFGSVLELPRRYRS